MRNKKLLTLVFLPAVTVVVSLVVGYIRPDRTPALNHEAGIIHIKHTAVYDEAVPPTCTKQGLSEGYHCPLCGERLVAQEILPITEHLYGEDTECTVCGYPLPTERLKYSNLYGATGLGTVTDTDIVISSYDRGSPVKLIGPGAFRDCTKLKSVTIPSSVMSISTEAFANCRGLTSIVIPNSVNVIAGSAFNDCLRLTSKKNGVRYVGAYAFRADCTVTSVTLKEDTESILPSAFYQCRQLESITIPDSVTWIGTGAFRDCESLTEITIPDSVTRIGYNAFNSCIALKKVKISEGVTAIESRVFFDCKSLVKVTIPDSVTSIGDMAFIQCTSLRIITIPASVKSIGEAAFRNCEKLDLIIFKGTKAQWRTIIKGDEWNEGMDAYAVLCQNGIIWSFDPPRQRYLE